MSDAKRSSDASFTDGSVEIGGTLVSIKLLIGLLILVGMGFFVLQNTQTVPLRWLFLRFEMPLWGLALVLFGAGLVMGWALQLRRQRRQRR